jgi:hypothetical protein
MPTRRARSRITLLTSVPRRHRERLQEVLQTYDRLTQATALAEHRAEVEARYVARTKETGRPPVDDRPRHRDRAGRLSISEVRRVLGEHGPGLTLMNDALGDTVRHQRRVLREAMIQRRTLEYSLGNPTELRCLWTAASVTAFPSSLVTSTGTVTTSPLVTTTGTGRNRLSTVALTTTQPALASLALLSIPTTHRGGDRSVGRASDAAPASGDLQLRRPHHQRMDRSHDPGREPGWQRRWRSGGREPGYLRGPGR